MDKEFIMKRLNESAERDEAFWSQVKKRMNEPSDQTWTVLDIHDVSDSCIDLVLARSFKGQETEWMDHWRFVATRNGFFGEPKVEVFFTSGPPKDEFLNANNK